MPDHVPMSNRLAEETSPYLLQHKDNPVDWHPWGPEALAEARERQVPVLLSVGYAACHWCHVMERESFEDETTAAYMNEHFVPVKVDREVSHGRTGCLVAGKYHQPKEVGAETVAAEPA